MNTPHDAAAVIRGLLDRWAALHQSEAWPEVDAARELLASDPAPEYDPSTGRLTCPHCGHAAHVREWTLIEGSHARIYRLRRFKSGAIEAYDEQHTDDSTQDFRIAHNPTAVCSREMPAPAALVSVLKWEED